MGTDRKGITANRAIVQLTSALNHAWQAIERDQPKIGDAVVIVQANGKGNYGHHCAQSWLHDGREVTEIVINADKLNRDADAVMGTLIHEAAHAINAANRVKDTSRQGRYHNQKFAFAARHIMGLTVIEDDKFGYVTTINDELREKYAASIKEIAATLTLFRKTFTRKTKVTEGWQRVTCGCCPKPVTLRISGSTFAEIMTACETRSAMAELNGVELPAVWECPIGGGPLFTDEYWEDVSGPMHDDDLRRARKGGTYLNTRGQHVPSDGILVDDLSAKLGDGSEQARKDRERRTQAHINTILPTVPF